METPDAPAGRRRLRGTSGATLVEYAVILALFAVPAVGASAYLTSKARAATVTNADCISKRPPPASCQAPTITTSTTATTIATSTTTQPSTSSSSSSSTSTTVALPSASATWDTTWSQWDTTTNIVRVRFSVKTSGNAPVAGVVVQGYYTDTASRRQTPFSCTTDAGGVCTPATYTVPYTPPLPASGTQVQAVITSVDKTNASPQVSTVSAPNSWTATK